METLDCTFKPKTHNPFSPSPGFIACGGVGDLHSKSSGIISSSSSSHRGGARRTRPTSAPRLGPSSSSFSYFSAASDGGEIRYNDTISESRSRRSSLSRGDARKQQWQSSLPPNSEKHLSRMRKAEELRAEKERKLNRCDGSNWNPRKTIATPTTTVTSTKVHKDLLPPQVDGYYTHV